MIIRKTNNLDGIKTSKVGIFIRFSELKTQLETLQRGLGTQAKSLYMGFTS